MNSESTIPKRFPSQPLDYATAAAAHVLSPGWRSRNMPQLFAVRLPDMRLEASPKLTIPALGVVQ